MWVLKDCYLTLTRFCEYLTIIARFYMNNKIDFTCGRDYPLITNASPNPYYVEILQGLYSGQSSELSAILQYVYQSSALHSNNKEVSYILKQIAIVEMHHLELLANAIISFGGLPYYINKDNQTFCTNNICYCTNLRCVIEQDLKDELSAIEFYTKSANLIQNESLKQLLLTIAEDEKKHSRILSSLLDELNCY